MKLLASSLSLCLIIARLSILAAAERCCLCDSCEDVAAAKVDMLTLSPFRPEEASTCDEIALELLDVEDESDTCTAVRLDFQTACCTADVGA